MSIITLTTDFGLKDYAVGALKGHIYNLLPTAHIVDISHYIEPFNILQTAYVLRNAYKYFPENTIHIIGVDNELHSQKDLLVMKYQNQYFISADNGFISLFCEENFSKKIYKIKLDNFYSIFPTLDFSVKIAQKIVEGVPLEEIGENTDNHHFVLDHFPTISKNKIAGCIIYIDTYGNVVSNITKSIIEKNANNRRFDIYFRFIALKNKSLEDIFSQYNEIEEKNKRYGNHFDGKEILIFNNLQHLELAIYRSNPHTVNSSSKLHGINYRDKVSINFIDN
ncbi:MAG: SAM-dependent chlorinase/fluorinase [Capnocytophaga sp.]|nr:SAM-dependent chlorinase/fluorinase [Capnocytophaga sp.]